MSFRVHVPYYIHQIEVALARQCVGQKSDQGELVALSCRSSRVKALRVKTSHGCVDTYLIQDSCHSHALDLRMIFKLVPLRSPLTEIKSTTPRESRARHSLDPSSLMHVIANLVTLQRMNK